MIRRTAHPAARREIVLTHQNVPRKLLGEFLFQFCWSGYRRMGQAPKRINIRTLTFGNETRYGCVMAALEVRPTCAGETS
ncbi:hypothetical protein [Fodinibius halophilus]|uniref:hypothetical protein n=1 Tax=Fodinibius halophilus TaxID=1736908 RepID=UPI0013EC3E01|nr:hypothetical protein [Fodinibius halophilus]